MVFAALGRYAKKKFRNVDYARIGRVAKYWRRAPHEYLDQKLNRAEAFLFDEACLVAVETENKEIEDRRKKQKEKEKRDAEFKKDMGKIFSGNDT